MYDYDNINTDPEWKRVILTLKCFKKIVRLHDVVIDSLGRSWAFKYVLKCIKHITSYIDIRISRKKDIDVKELVSLCDAEEALTNEIYVAAGVKRTNSLGRRIKVSPSQSKVLCEKIPVGLVQAISVLEEKLHFMKEQASTRAYSGKSKKAPAVVRRSHRILKNKLSQNKTTKLLVCSQEQKLPLLSLNDDDFLSDNENDPLEENDSANGENNENEYAFVENVDIDELDDDEFMARFTAKR